MPTVLAILWAAVAGPSPFARGKVPREERWGTIWLSDGVGYEGLLRLTMSKRLTVYDEASKEWRKFKLSELERIRFGVEKAEQLPVWRWKESGSDEKVLTGESYPNLILWCEAVATSGERVRGHILGTVLYVEGEQKKKFILRKYVRGKTGEKTGQVVHVREIVFHAKGKSPSRPR